MRLTVDLDGDLLTRALARFPSGTSESAVVEAALRAWLGETGRRERSPAMQRLIDEGLVTPATATGPAPKGAAVVSLEQLVADGEADRSEH